MTPIKIIIADDHPLCLSGFKRMLDVPEIELVGEATNGIELVELARNLKPNVIITDIKMPHMGGIEATKILSKELPNTGIIAMSIMDDSTYIMDMIDAGAKGYLLKSAIAPDVIAAVHTVNNGETYYCKETTTHMIKILAKNDFEEIQKSARDQFSEREIEVIELVCKGYSNKEIAKKLDIKKRTSEWHRQQIMKKIGVKSSAGIITYAIKNNIYKNNDNT